MLIAEAPSCRGVKPDASWFGGQVAELSPALHVPAQH